MPCFQNTYFQTVKSWRSEQQSNPGYHFISKICDEISEQSYVHFSQWVSFSEWKKLWGFQKRFQNQQCLMLFLPHCLQISRLFLQTRPLVFFFLNTSYLFSIQSECLKQFHYFHRNIAMCYRNDISFNHCKFISHK